jgi:hypothetical protein
MSYRTMTIAIDEAELEALTRLARAELRRPRDQARVLLRAALLGNQPDSDGPNMEKHNGAVTNLTGTHGAVAAIAG